MAHDYGGPRFVKDCQTCTTWHLILTNTPHYKLASDIYWKNTTWTHFEGITVPLDIVAWIYNTFDHYTRIDNISHIL